jgi:hypothetical protein
MGIKVRNIICIPLLSWPIVVSAQVRKDSFYGCWTGFDHAINRYVDSLNYLTDSSQLPKFLADSLIDWRQHNSFKLCLSDQNEKISTRVAILDRVYREDVLYWIIRSKNKDYDRLYNRVELEKKFNSIGVTDYVFPDFPFMKYSLRQLAKMRLDEVVKQRKLINKE